MKLDFIDNPRLDPTLVQCPYCREDGHIHIHSQKERRYKCTVCLATFSETRGSAFYGMHYPIWVVRLVLILIAYNCSHVAIEKAFGIPRATILNWEQKAGLFIKKLQEAFLVEKPLNCSQIQADELCLTTQQGHIWISTAMDVFTRFFLWGECSYSRDKGLIKRLFTKVRSFIVQQPLLIVTDGFRSYYTVIRQLFVFPERTGKRGRPKHLAWPNLHIGQVLKSHSGRKLVQTMRQLLFGSLSEAYRLLVESQGDVGVLNTSYIERLNATFRARLSIFNRRTRHLARHLTRVDHSLFLVGGAYNFCTVHETLNATPAMVAGLTDHVWTLDELLGMPYRSKTSHAIS